MKKIVALLLMTSLAIGIAGCGASGDGNSQGSSSSGSSASAESASSGETGESSGIKLGMCIPARDQFFSALERSASEKAAELGIELQVVEAKDDISTQISQIENFKNNGFTSVAVALVSTESYQEALNAAGDMNVIFFNRIPSDTSCLDGEKTIYVGMPEIEAGGAQGEWLADYFEESGEKDLNGVLFMGILGHPSTGDRTDGAKAALEEAGYNINWVFEDTAEFDRAKAMDKFTQFLGTGEDFDFVLSNNDEMALGVIEACVSAGVEIDFPIIGVDGTETACQAILDGTMSATVNQNPILMGATTVECVQDIENGVTPEGCNEDFVYYTAVEVVTPETAEAVRDSFAE